MDLRNVIFAIALSFAVLFGWSVIFETPQIEQEKKIQNTENNQNSPTPSVNLDLASAKSVSREDAIKLSQRVKFENENVEGSIALKGGLIDDITFKKYNETIKNDEKVTYLNPSETILNEKYAEKKDIDNSDRYKPVPFYPSEPYDNNAHICKILLDRNNNMLIEDKYDKIDDNTIVEFRYDNSKDNGFKWIPIRVRHDKTAEFRSGQKITVMLIM